MTFLEDFYYGNITPNVMVPETNRTLRKAALEAEQKLRERLCKEDEQLLIDYSNKELNVYSEAVKNHFLFGFRYSMLMMMEVLRQSDDLIG